MAQLVLEERGESFFRRCWRRWATKMDVYLRTSKRDHIVARIDARPGLKEGQSVAMYVDVSRVHVFEQGETGSNVTLESDTDDKAVV